MKKLVIAALSAASLFASASAQDLSGKKVYLNPGHGGFEATTGTRIAGEFGNGYRPDGSVSTDRWNPSIPFPTVCEEGCWESKHNLWRALELQRLLEEAGAEVIMSRTQNRIEDDRILTEIGKEATSTGADMFISIHSNGNGANYLLTLFRGADPRPGQPFNINDPDLPESKEMAVTAWKHLHDNPVTCWQSLKSPNSPYAVADSAFYSGWGDGYHLGVFRNLWIPGYLAETAFHDYKPETHRMLNEDYSKMVAFQLFTATCESLGAEQPKVGIVCGAVKDGKRIFRDPLFLGATAGDHDQYKPVNGATVTLTGNGVNLTYETDNYYNGFYYFPGLTPGTYHLKVDAEGYDPYEEDVVCEAAKCRGAIALLNDPTYDPSSDFAQPAIFASELKSFDGNQVSFLLNADATSVTINLIKDGKTVKSIDFGPQAMGHVTLTLPGDEVAEGDYNWSVTARAEAFLDEEPKQISQNGDPALDIANARGLAIDNNPESPYFGRIYVSSVAANGYKGARTGTGIYILDPAFGDPTGQGTKAHTGGVAWSGNSSPYHLTVAEDGTLFIGDWNDHDLAGVHVMDPANPATSCHPLFGGEYTGADGIYKNGGEFIHGSCTDLIVTGTGDNTTLWTLDEDFTANAVGTSKTEGYLLRYEIGSVRENYTKGPDQTYGNFGAHLANMSQSMASDGHGGIWVCQYRDTNSDQYPCALHLNAKGEWDYYCGDGTIFKTSGPIGGAIAVNRDGSLVAIAGKTDIRVAEATYDADGKPTLKLKYAMGSTYGSRPFAAAFDAADNLYVVYNAEGGGVSAWALPKENNEYTTTSLQPVKVAAGVFASEVADHKIFFDGTTFSAQGELIELFTASGVKVAEGYTIDGTKLAAGVYIARAGKQTIKVVK